MQLDVTIWKLHNLNNNKVPDTIDTSELQLE